MRNFTNCEECLDPDLNPNPHWDHELWGLAKEQIRQSADQWDICPCMGVDDKVFPHSYAARGSDVEIVEQVAVLCCPVLCCTACVTKDSKHAYFNHHKRTCVCTSGQNCLQLVPKRFVLQGLQHQASFAQ